MARIVRASQARQFVLDAGAIIALQRGDSNTRAVLEWARQKHYRVVIPTPVVAQVHRGGHDRAGVDRVLKAIDEYVPTSMEVARHAGELLGRSGLTDAVDAIVAVAALRGAPSMVITSDPADLTRLTKDEPQGARIIVFGV